MIGPSAVNVEGVLKSPPDTAYVLGVTSVTYVRGYANKWNGEPLTVSKEFVANTTQRTFSKSRTWLTVAAAAAGVAVVVLGFGLSGGGSPPTEGGGGGGGQSFRGIPGGISGGH
jgi:trimethylamine:corrinoid methyltransferase-like protein